MECTHRHGALECAVPRCRSRPKEEKAREEARRLQASGSDTLMPSLRLLAETNVKPPPNPHSIGGCPRGNTSTNSYSIDKSPRPNITASLV